MGLNKILDEIANDYELFGELEDQWIPFKKNDATGIPFLNLRHHFRHVEVFLIGIGRKHKKLTNTLLGAKFQVNRVYPIHAFFILLPI